MTLKEKLEEQWVSALSTLSEMDIDDECYNIQTSRVEHLEKLMADLDKAELDASTKMEQLESDKSEQKRKGKLEIFKISAPIVAAFLMGCVKKMILLMTLLIALLISAVIIIAGLGVAGGVTIVLFSDVIVCVGLIVLVVRHFVKKK